MSPSFKLFLTFVLVILGFILILTNAVNYLFDFKWALPSPAIGLIIVAVGTAMIRKNWRSREGQQDLPKAD
jgi:uncharacterized membrane protein